MNPSVRLVLPVIIALLGIPARAADIPLSGQTFTLPEGFEIELVAGPPLVLRPMMADFDELGRLYVADSSGSNDKVEKQLEEKPHRIVRLADTDGDGRFDESVVFADKLMFPEGVLWHDGAVYTGAPPSIWKLEDTDDDGVADRRTEWHQGLTLTGCANDLHGPYRGPDGWIYWCKGGFAKQTYDRPGHRPIADSAAHVFRALPDHTSLDAVMGGGMDNPVEVAFSAEGEVFFTTTFFHHPQAGMRDAIVHCIYGGAYPKVQGVLDELQRTGDLLPSLVELGPAAACALTRYDSSAFGSGFEGNLFSTEFNLRKVRRHELTTKGSTFTSRNSDFLVSDNADFHPTDVFEDADGSLLVIDTGGWYKICCPTSQLAKPDVLGGIYRIRRRGAGPIEDPRGLKLDWATPSSTELAKRLDDRRSAVRQRATDNLGRKGPDAIEALRGTLVTSTSVVARRNAVWALTRIDSAPAREAVRLALEDADAGVRQTALHSVAMRRDVLALPRLLEFLKGGHPMLQRKAAEALGRVGGKSAVPALLAAAGTFRSGFPEDADAVRIHEHAILFALIEIADPVGTRAGLASTNSYLARAALIALDQMDGGGLTVEEVAPLLGSEDGTLKTTALWITSHHREWGGQLAGHFRERLTSGVLEPDELEVLQHQIARFEGDPAIQTLVANCVTSAEVAGSIRRMLLRSMAEAGLRQPPQVWEEALAASLAVADEELVRTAVSAIRAMPMAKTGTSAVSPALLRVAADPARPVELRIEALAAMPTGLPAVDDSLFELLLRQVDAESPATQRSAAASVLSQATLTESQWITLAGRLRKVGPMELNRLLEAFEGVNDEGVGREMVAALADSKVLSSIRVDLLQQRLKQFPLSVRESGQVLLRRLDVNPEELAAQLDAVLAEVRQLGGDVRRGQAIFNSQKTACSTCHAMGYLGGRVGPDLTSIGQIRTERDLLEAILYPSASFVRSFEPVMVATRDEEDYSGVVLSETAEELVLATGADVTVRLGRQEVTEMQPGTVSIMPAGLHDQLSKQELADLVTFLKNTKWGAE